MAKKSKSANGSGSESASGTPRLQEIYNNTVRPALADELSKKKPSRDSTDRKDSDQYGSRDGRYREKTS